MMNPIGVRNKMIIYEYKRVLYEKFVKYGQNFLKYGQIFRIYLILKINILFFKIGTFTSLIFHNLVSILEKLRSFEFSKMNLLS